MIGILTHHWVKQESIGEARLLLDGNGNAQSKAAGFVKRRTLYSLCDPTKITSLVIWESHESYDAWRKSPEREATMLGSEKLWSKTPESDRFEASNEILPSNSLP
jgi:heme-degrading monooxygenase HmoA